MDFIGGAWVDGTPNLEYFQADNLTNQLKHNILFFKNLE